MGTFVGEDDVGEEDGTTVGLPDGFALGETVGEALGEEIGLDVGWSDGDVVGFGFVGDTLGCETVGEDVGLGVLIFIISSALSLDVVVDVDDVDLPDFDVDVVVVFLLDLVDVEVDVVVVSLSLSLLGARHPELLLLLLSSPWSLPPPLLALLPHFSQSVSNSLLFFCLPLDVSSCILV